MLLELPGRHPLLRGTLRLQETARPGLIVDARRLEFASPLDLAAVAALAHTHAAGGAEIALLLPERRGVASYLQRMDLLKHLPEGARVAGPLPEEERNDHSASLLEVTRLTGAAVRDVNQRIGLVATSHLGKRFGRQAFTGLGELIDNAVSHGASELGAFITAQAYSGRTTGRRRLEVSICDTGIGVLDHLRRNQQHSDVTDSIHALERALSPRISGTDEDRGYGLPDVLDGVRKTAITSLILRSGDGAVTASHYRQHAFTSYRRIPERVAGTWAWLRVSFPG
ncbi:hypothetical protein [Streptomyces europaeiscabiei]|uniref:hypothetical protein n=1 Tax=Streptomyces europaeiscabiei TaxID=146819 RepID=UPI0029BA582C|nr:hypothetical protein [Streptomyces europaeiscabiei]MDX3847873.1 hypothetical protein [Streptomyces europaeiscabiei]